MSSAPQQFILSSVPKLNRVREVHTSKCKHLPGKHSRIKLGEYATYAEAEEMAKMFFDNIDGCYYCQHEHNKLANEMAA